MILVLDSRETAALVWIGLGLAFAVANKRTRPNLVACVRVLLNPKVVAVVASFSLYCGAATWLLARSSLRTSETTKVATFWISGALITFLPSAIRYTEPGYRDVLRNVVLAVLSPALVAEGLVSLRPFSLPVELILVPLILGATILSFRRESALSCQSIIGVAVMGASATLMLAWSLAALLQKPSDYVNLAAAFNFTVPMLLSLGLVPYLLAIRTYSIYETVLGVLKFGIKDPALRRFAAVRAALSFRHDVDALDSWRQLVFAHPPKGRRDAMTQISEVIHQQRQQNRPPRIHRSRGWSPEFARQFLLDVGLSPSKYKRLEDEWFCSASTELATVSGMDSLSYYLSGSAAVVTSLKLVLFVLGSEPADAQEALFSRAARILVDRACRGSVSPHQLTDHLLAATSDLVVEDWRLEIRRTPWRNGDANGYRRHMVITVRWRDRPVQTKTEQADQATRP